MQPETLNRSIQPTPTVHPRGFTPRPVQLSMAVDTATTVRSRRVGPRALCPLLTPHKAGSSMYGYGDFDGPGFPASAAELA